MIHQSSLNMQNSLNIRVINCLKEVRRFEIKDLGKGLNSYKRVAAILLRNQRKGREDESRSLQAKRKKTLEFLILLFRIRWGLRLSTRQIISGGIGILEGENIQEKCCRVISNFSRYSLDTCFVPGVFLFIYFVASGLSCSSLAPQLWHVNSQLWHACGIQFSDQGLKPGRLHWERGVLATVPPGKSR